MIHRIVAAALAAMFLSGTTLRIVVCAAEQNWTEQGEPTEAAPQMKLHHAVELGDARGSFPCLGDLDNDGRVDFLLYRQGSQTTPGYLVALDHQGRKLWQRGDASIRTHMPDGKYREPALRGVAMIFDVDRDGRSEVIAEFWQDGKPLLCIFDGATGKVERSRPSPLDLDVRGGSRSRCHPAGRIAFLDGKDKPAAIVLLYGASGHVPCHVVALDPKLETLWHLQSHGNTVAHVPCIEDVNGDGRDEILVGRILVDGRGKVLWEKTARQHPDCAAAVELPGRADRGVLISICNTGPAFCTSADGSTIWAKTTQDVSHGQGIWAGNFLDDEPGEEVMILRSGHVGDFITVRGSDGEQLAAFQQQREFRGYPDFPCVVNWQSPRVQSLWIPIDRRLVDGKGRVVADLGTHEPRVQKALRWGTTKSQVATQAFAVDLCGDRREELALYQPYSGEQILIFTQADSDGREKPYVHQRNVYNMRTYF